MFNAKFHVPPKKRTDFHRSLSNRETEALSETLCRLEERRVQNDFTISFRASWYQLLATPGLAIRSKDSVLIREYPDTSLSFSIRGKKVLMKQISKRSSYRLKKQDTLVPLD